MKQIFEVGTIQYFTYTTSLFFKIHMKTEEHWLIRNVKYIYANSEDEAKEKYKKWFFKEYKKITRNWRNWYLESDDNVNLDMYENCINITSTEIIVLDNEYLNVNFDQLKEDMQANDFKEWWFDNGKGNKIPE